MLTASLVRVGIHAALTDPLFRVPLSNATSMPVRIGPAVFMVLVDLPMPFD